MCHKICHKISDHAPCEYDGERQMRSLDMLQTLKRHFSEDIGREEEFRRVRNLLSIQCTELEEQNHRLRVENRELAQENNDYRCHTV